MRRRRAFTLLELLIVVTIIGILVAFILRASYASLKAAEQKATLSLIVKLQAAISDRMDALSNPNLVPTAGHYAIANTYSNNFRRTAADPPWPTGAPNQRAYVIALYDYLRSEAPDSFVVQATIPANATPQSSQGLYPLNFGGVRFGNNGDVRDFLLPLGASGPIGAYPPASGMPAPPGAIPRDNPPVATGIYGASFAVAAGIYKQLGYSPQGTDGTDNDGDGFIDDLREGLTGLPAGAAADMGTRLLGHRHATARSEMLYAILVEGGGAGGSVFSRDEFTEREVRDTDGDGLMEFVDAWEQPIQWFARPIGYRSDAQLGYPDMAKILADVAASAPPGPYDSIYQQRDPSPLDQNSQLLAPAWWSAGSPTSPYPNQGPGLAWTVAGFRAPDALLSGGALTFMNLFGPVLTDPFAVLAGKPGFSTDPAKVQVLTTWDRSIGITPSPYGKLYARRGYRTEPLVLSGGPDKVPGVALLGVDYRTVDERRSFPLLDGSLVSPRDGTGAPVDVTVVNLIQIENQGGRIDPNRASPPYYVPTFSDPATYRNDTSSYLEEAGQDDISGHSSEVKGGASSH